MANTTTVQLRIESSGAGNVYFLRTGQRAVHAWPISPRRFPTLDAMVAEASRVAERKLGAGNFHPDVLVSTPETRAAHVRALMALPVTE
jgi:hypothetical protein